MGHRLIGKAVYTDESAETVYRELRAGGRDSIYLTQGLTLIQSAPLTVEEAEDASMSAATSMTLRWDAQALPIVADGAATGTDQAGWYLYWLGED